MSRPLVHAADAPARRAARHAATPPELLALLAGGGEVSGAEIATTLGITRAAVWKQIEQLRARGLAVHAEAGRGYRLEAPIELLDAARIDAAIGPDERAHVGVIDVRWQIDSTSSELARTADALPLPRACLAEIQTAGRGRRGRRWQTPLAGGIALSFARRFDGGMASLSGLSLVAGIAVLRALADVRIDGAALKWPNDIVANGKKLGGILVELGGDALGPCRAIVGIGLNVRIGASEGALIDQPWTDLASLGTTPSRNLVAGRMLARLAEVLDMFAPAGFAAFEAEYARHDALRGRDVIVASGNERWTALADGVTSRGALRVVRDGRAIEVDSGEVSVRAAGGEPCSS
ncbi:MAG TPA: biotin--[acetyl-CoA-carboxylase] ligase [Rhodanobacteraceae bacterium]|nr:biotin--[acetyl-CoA-carboxylase] ligase [Rhodanobacteraceae bacterium]